MNTPNSAPTRLEKPPRPRRGPAAASVPAPAMAARCPTAPCRVGGAVLQFDTPTLRARRGCRSSATLPCRLLHAACPLERRRWKSLAVTSAPTVWLAPRV